jgi:hypothetical protein
MGRKFVVFAQGIYFAALTAKAAPKTLLKTNLAYETKVSIRCDADCLRNRLAKCFFPKS